MPQLITIPIRLTAQREATLRRELGIPADQPLRSVVAYYAVRDTIYGWLDGADVQLDPDATDEIGPRRESKVSERPYKKKFTIKRKR